MSSVTLPIIIALAATVGGSAIYGGPLDNTPLVSLGAGGFDIFDNAEQDSGMDFRAEYRFGDAWFWNIKPLIAVEATSDGGGGVFGGVVADFLFGEQKNWVVSPSFAAGFWGEGGGKDMGYPVEFRSQVEAGYRFDNNWRLTGAISHISNAELGDDNPGAEQATVYLHIPADSLLPR